MEIFMIKILMFITLSQFVFSNEYYIQLGSFKKVGILKKKLIIIPEYILNNIKIVKQNQWYVPITIVKQNYNDIIKNISLYRQYFKNAIIINSKTLDKYEVINLKIDKNITKIKDNYYIQLGSFRKVERLKKRLAIIPDYILKNIKIVKQNQWYVPITIAKKDYKNINKNISLYKKYFKSAIITNSKTLDKYELINLKIDKNITKIKDDYYIQLGSFLNIELIKVVLSNIPYSISKNIIIVRQNQWYIPLVLNKKLLEDIKQDIFLYLKYFKDAIITRSKTLDKYENINYNLQNKKPLFKFRKKIYKNKSINLHKKTYKNISTNLHKRIYKKKLINLHINNNLKKNIKNKIFYMAYKADKKKSSLLIKLIFKENTILYRPIIGDIGLTEAKYLIRDNKLFMYTDSFNINSIYSIIEQKNLNFLLISSWDKQKKISTLRYYFRLIDAKKYLGLKLHSKLSRILENNKFNLRLRSN